MGIAVFVEFEQFGRKRLAAGVALALLLIDVDSQLSCHGKCFSQIISRDLLVRARVPVILARWFFGCLLAAPISYILLHSRPPRSSRGRIVARPMSQQPLRKPETAYHHGDLREALVRAALKEAEQGGPESISIKALAKKLGVSQPAPYRHFADRDALLQAATAEAFREFNAVLREALNEPSKHSKLS